MAATPTYKTTTIRLATMADFTGGWNLRGNAFQLGMNETNDMLDVDIQVGGGFIQRPTVQSWGGTGLLGVVTTLTALQTPVFQQVIAQVGNRLQWSSGGNWTTFGPVLGSSTANVRSTVFNNLLYLQNGVNQPLRWDGALCTVMGSNWNNNIGGEGGPQHAPSPTGYDGNMPVASLITAHMGRVMIANTVEGAVQFPNRIRWSHPGLPEDWRAQDFIDIDTGHDGDSITAIVSYHGRLLIYKNRSCYELVGYGPENWQVVPMSQDIGAVSQEAVCISDVGLFTFSWPQGVYLDKGTGPYPIFDKVWPLVRDSRIPAQFQGKIQMEWINRLLYCAVPMDGSSVNNRVLVYNPWIWKHRYMRFLEGPWYPYSIPAGALLEVQQPELNIIHIASHSSLPALGQLEQDGAQDQWSGQPATNIPAYYSTRWYDVGSPSVIKRWRHPDVVMRGGMTAPLQVSIKRDYDDAAIYKTFWIAGTPAPEPALTWTQTLTPPVITVVTPIGTTGATPYSYIVTAVSATGETTGAAVGTSKGNPVLSGTNYNQVTWLPTLGATAYNIYRQDPRVLGTGSSFGPPGPPPFYLVTQVASTVTTFSDIGAQTATQNPPTQNTAFGLGLNTFWDDGTGTLGDAWSGQPQLSEVVVRGSSMGSARAVQMTFMGPSGIQWGVDAITTKYIPKRIRG
jgi:hypothetical protein